MGSSFAGRGIVDYIVWCKSFEGNIAHEKRVFSGKWWFLPLECIPSTFNLSGGVCQERNECYFFIGVTIRFRFRDDIVPLIFWTFGVSGLGMQLSVKGAFREDTRVLSVLMWILFWRTADKSSGGEDD